MLTTVALLLGSAVVIYLACELFTNGVEWMGHRLNVSQTATGTVLAALGTALPESVVTFVATALGQTDARREIGIGAALGGPLALSTIAYAVVGVCLVAYGRQLGRGHPVLVQVDGRRLRRDQAWFLAIFAAKIALGVVAFAFKPWLGAAFLAVYAWYFWTEMKDEGEDEEGEMEPLTLRRRDPSPHVGWAILQTGGAMVVIFAASRVFVGQLEAVGPWLGISPQMTALLLSPLATELPETMNAVIWVRQGKERLALANISGAMMIQATVPTAFGLFFTPWILDRPLLVAAGVTGLAVAVLYSAFRHPEVSGARLTQVAWLYGVFAAVSFALR
jgi:cation:H+ antiporter